MEKNCFYLGFLGIAKCIKSKQIFIPHKKKKNQELSEEQKNENCMLARFRVGVENTIAMIKRFFILRIENRMHPKEKLDSAVELCACAWNFHKKYK
jgi:DDE superfamily endonuclease